MTPAGFVLVLHAVWLVVLLLAAGLPLATGRIRMGMQGEAPIERAREPGRFWTAFALSVGGLGIGYVALRAFLKAIMPGPWGEAMRTLGM